jgi:hypothetical protein
MIIPIADTSLFPMDEPIYLPTHVIRDFLEFAGIIESSPNNQRVKVNGDGMAIILKHLNPWVIGWYERSDKATREYAREALVSHLLKGNSSAKSLAEKIVTVFLETYSSHGATIFRDEARRIGLPVKDCPIAIWKQLERMSDFYDYALRRQRLGRILETSIGFQVRHEKPHRSCPNCKEDTEVEEGSRFCPYCGNPMYDQCRECQALLQPGWKFCPKCSHPAGTSTLSAPTAEPPKALSKSGPRTGSRAAANGIKNP